MNVFENVAFGLRMKGMYAREIEKRVVEMLEMTGLQDFRKREISRLSGGEKQRVALARSLVTRPDLLMLDEPLGALDTSLRERLLDETRQLIRNLGIGTIYVTHDQQEAYAISDRIAILNQGRIEQIDTPLQVYQRPRTRFVAEFLGLQNVVRTDLFRDRFPQVKTRFMLLHPNGLQVAEDGALRGTVIRSKFQGDRITLQVVTDEGVVLRFGVSSTAQPDIVEGASLRIAVDPTQVVPLEDDLTRTSQWQEE
jgi:ABC-type Fe3+/spermidine/putrescine transport system ATPase subunit